MRRRAFLAAAGATLAAGCSALSRSYRGTIKLDNMGDEPVFVAVSVEPADAPDEQRTPTFRTRYYVRPYETLVLPEAVGGRKHRVSAVVYAVADGERGETLGHVTGTFDPAWDATTLYVRYDPDGRGATMEVTR